MPNFLDLPSELLIQIAEYLEGDVKSKPRWSLSRGSVPAHVFTCKRWCELALPIYLDSLNLEDMKFSMNDMTHMPSKGSEIWEYVSSEVERMSIRLNGRPSTDVAPEFLEDAMMSDDGGSQSSTPPSSYDTAQAVDHESSIYKLERDRTEDKERDFDPLDFREQVARSLINMSEILAACRNLIELLFQAYPGFQKDLHSRWEYLDFQTMRRFVLRTPPNLKYLTLDLPGTSTYSSCEGGPNHLCPSLARCIFRAENVRLRARYICPAALGVERIEIDSQPSFDQSQASGPRSHERAQLDRFGRPEDQSPIPRDAGQPFSEKSLRYTMDQTCDIKGDIKLRTLLVRLSLPYFSMERSCSSNATDTSTSLYTATQCPEFRSSKDFHLGQLMGLAARRLLDTVPDIRELKISYPTSPPGVLCYSINVREWRMEYPWDEAFVYEDDGANWDAWEYGKDLAQGWIQSVEEMENTAINNDYFGSVSRSRTFDSSSKRRDSGIA